MKYELKGDNNTSNIIKTVLNNRGITNWELYLNLNTAPRDSFSSLKNIDNAVEMFNKHFQNQDRLLILYDCDNDGVCSATIMYKMIKSLDPEYPVSIAVHRGNKAHGLSSYDFDIPEGTKLLIVPDAGSNDLKQHIELHEQGIDCICLDHHHTDIDIDSSPAIIVNNQTSPDYQNKDCCGASITLEFCRALDEFYWTDYADNLLDLAAVANISDVMDLSSFETRAIVNEGLNNIKNKMLKAMIEAQDFSMKGVISPFTVAFYIAPLVNSMIRIAPFEDRQLLIRAFCEDESETFEYTKRGTSEPTTENIYEHVIRLMRSCKSRQDRARDKAFTLLMSKEAENSDKVAIIDATDCLESAYTGLVAIKLSESLNKPVLLVRKIGNEYYGSGRAFDYCPIDDFRELVEECPYSTMSAGHPGAFGCGLSNIDNAKQWFNDKLQDISFEKVYVVDFVVDAEEMSISWCLEMDKYKKVFAHGVDEPLWLIKNLKISNENTRIVGKNLDTIQISDNDIKYVMFKCSEGNEVFEWLSNNWGDEEAYINLVGTLSVNTYNGYTTAQVIIKECEFTIQN